MNARRRYLSSAVLALSTAWFTLAGPIAIVNAQGAGTSLVASVDAVGVFVTTVEYDWVTAIEAVPTELTLATAESGTINYTATATRTEVSRTDTFGASGTVLVTNTGDRSTVGLNISVAIQTKIRGVWTAIATTSVSIRDNPVLDGGETGTYTWEVSFTPNDGETTYRAVAFPTIQNHSGHLGTAYGPEPKFSFALPSTAGIIRVDGTASVSITQDDLSASGFRVSATPRDVVFSDTGSSTFSTSVTNSTATSGTYTFNTTATLTEGDSGTQRRDSTGVSIFVPLP